MRKIQKGRGKRVISGSFLDPDLPRLASGTPGTPYCLGLKEPTRLGKVPRSQMPFFAINRHEGGLRKGFQHSALRDFERNKGEEEERRENEVEALPNCDCNQPLHRSSFSVLHSSSG